MSRHVAMVVEQVFDHKAFRHISVGFTPWVRPAVLRVHPRDEAESGRAGVASRGTGRPGRVVRPDMGRPRVRRFLSMARPAPASSALALAFGLALSVCGLGLGLVVVAASPAVALSCAPHPDGAPAAITSGTELADCAPNEQDEAGVPPAVAERPSEGSRLLGVAVAVAASIAIVAVLVVAAVRRLTRSHVRVVAT